MHSHFYLNKKQNYKSSEVTSSEWKLFIKLVNFYDKFIVVNELFSKPTFVNNEAIAAEEQLLSL